MVNAWGLANRPAGLGGHIWVVGEQLRAVDRIRRRHRRRAAVPRRTAQHLDSRRERSRRCAGGCPFAGHADRCRVQRRARRFVITQGSITGPGQVHLRRHRRNDLGLDRTQERRRHRRPRLVRVGRWPTRGERGSAYFGLAVRAERRQVARRRLRAGPRDPHLRLDKVEEMPTVGFENPFVKKGATIKPGDFVPWNVTTIGQPRVRVLRRARRGRQR